MLYIYIPLEGGSDQGADDMAIHKCDLHACDCRIHGEPAMPLESCIQVAQSQSRRSNAGPHQTEHSSPPCCKRLTLPDSRCCKVSRQLDTDRVSPVSNSPRRGPPISSVQRVKHPTTFALRCKERQGAFATRVANTSPAAVSCTGTSSE